MSVDFSIEFERIRFENDFQGEIEVEVKSRHGCCSSCQDFEFLTYIEPEEERLLREWLNAREEARQNGGDQ